MVPRVNRPYSSCLFFGGKGMKQRFIFDLDGTVLQTDFSYEIEYFQKVLDEEKAKRFISQISSLLTEYERTHIAYDYDVLREFLCLKTGILFTDNIIREWVEAFSLVESPHVEGIQEVLEYLKGQEKSLVVLTNWIRETQVARLRRANLLDYFDEVYAGDMYLKPNRISYQNACGVFSMEEAVIIGDSLEFDVLAPMEFGMDAIYYNPRNKDGFDKKKVKSIGNMLRIKEMF